MPVHIGEISSEVAVTQGGLPLTEGQLDALAKAVMKRIEEAKRADEQSREATRLRREAAPRSPVSD